MAWCSCMSEYGIRVSEWDLVCGRRDATNKLVICGDQELFVAHPLVESWKTRMRTVEFAWFYKDVERGSRFESRVRDALEKVLDAFPEAAGRLEKLGDRWGVWCGNQGAGFTTGDAPVDSHLEAQRVGAADAFFDLVDASELFDGEPLLRVKVSRFLDGTTFCVAASWAHVLCDAGCFIDLLARAWSDADAGRGAPRRTSAGRNLVPRSRLARAPSTASYALFDPVLNAAGNALTRPSFAMRALANFVLSADELDVLVRDAHTRTGAAVARSDAVVAHATFLVGLLCGGAVDVLHPHCAFDVRAFADEDARDAFCSSAYARPVGPMTTFDDAGAPAAHAAAARAARDALTKDGFWDAFDADRAKSDLDTPAVLFHDFAGYDEAAVAFSDTAPALACLGLPYWRERAAAASARSAASPVVSFCALRPGAAAGSLDVAFTVPNGDVDEAAALLRKLAEAAKALHPVLRNKLRSIAENGLTSVAPFSSMSLL